MSENCFYIYFVFSAVNNPALMSFLFLKDNNETECKWSFRRYFNLCQDEPRHQ